MLYKCVVSALCEISIRTWLAFDEIEVNKERIICVRKGLLDNRPPSRALSLRSCDGRIIAITRFLKRQRHVKRGKSSSIGVPIGSIASRLTDAVVADHEKLEEMFLVSEVRRWQNDVRVPPGLTRCHNRRRSIHYVVLEILTRDTSDSDNDE